MEDEAVMGDWEGVGVRRGEEVTEREFEWEAEDEGWVVLIVGRGEEVLELLEVEVEGTGSDSDGRGGFRVGNVNVGKISDDDEVGNAVAAGDSGTDGGGGGRPGEGGVDEYEVLYGDT